MVKRVLCIHDSASHASQFAFPHSNFIYLPTSHFLSSGSKRQHFLSRHIFSYFPPILWTISPGNCVIVPFLTWSLLPQCFSTILCGSSLTSFTLFPLEEVVFSLCYILIINYISFLKKSNLFSFFPTRISVHSPFSQFPFFIFL